MVRTTRLPVDTFEGVSVQNVTPLVSAYLAEAPFQAGVCVIALTGGPCALTLSESAEEELDDLIQVARNHLGAPSPAGAARDRLDTPASAAASALAHTLALPVRDGSLATGSWQAILLLDAGGPARRTIDVTVVGA